MKLKFINLLLASVLLVGSAQVFTSCKDNEADLFTNLKEETITLRDRLAQDEKLIADLRAALTKEINNRTEQDKYLKEEIDRNLTRIKNLQNQLDELNKAYKEGDQKLRDRINALETELHSLEATVKDQAKEIANLKADIKTLQDAVKDLQALKAYIDGQISDLDTKYDGIIQGLISRIEKLEAIDHNDIFTRLEVLESGLSKVQTDLGTLTEKVDGIDADVTILNAFMNEWKTQLPTIQENAEKALAQAEANKTKIEELAGVIEDLKAESEAGDDYLKGLIKDLQIEIAEDILPQIEALAANDAILKELIDALREDINNKYDDLNGKLDNYATLDELAKATATLQAQAEANYEASISYTMYMCSGLRMYINSVNKDLQDYKDANDLEIVKIWEAIAGLEDLIAGKADQADLDDLSNVVETLSGKVDILTGLLEGLEERVTALENKTYPTLTEEEVQALIDAALAPYKTLPTDVASLQNLYDTLSDAVDTNTQAIAGLNTAINGLNNKIDNVAGRVNSVIIQKVHNPIIGSFNLPIGVNTSMLLAWWGEMVNGSEFPTADPTWAYNDGDADYLGLTDADLAALGNPNKDIDPGLAMLTNADGKGVLGTVYMTANPANTDLGSDKYTVNIVNSLGKATPIEIKPVPSDEEIKFGYTRGGTDNGFWESQATINVTKSDIAGIEFQFRDMNAFTASVKQIINNGIKSVTPGTIAKLSAALYEQVNGVLPALAISVSWNEDGTTNMATSNYGLAAATLHARGLHLLNALDGKIKPIPSIPDISNLQDRFNAWYDSFKNKVVINLGTSGFKVEFGNIKVNISAPTVSFNGVNSNINANIDDTVTANADLEVNITVDVDGKDYPGTGNATGTVTVPINTNATVDLSGLLGEMEAAVNEALNDAMGNVGADITAEINSMLAVVASDIETAVNDMLSSMSTNINTQITQILDDIQKEINGKFEGVAGRLDGILNRAEGLIARLNKVLTEPSYYLQPVLLYEGAQRAGILSTSKAAPTVFVVSGDAAVKLVPTTYTLETVVPLYQKYVAVTKVWKNGALDNAARDAANALEGMNEVLPSNRHIVPLKLQKGCTYEIVYQGMDYLGQVSGRKYYVTVK